MLSLVPDDSQRGRPDPEVNMHPPTNQEKISAIINCVQDLRDLEIESNVQLPKICVVGDQSARRSSLIEAPSKIQGQRAADTCTKCPLELQLKKPASNTTRGCVGQ